MTVRWRGRLSQLGAKKEPPRKKDSLVAEVFCAVVLGEALKWQSHESAVDSGSS